MKITIGSIWRGSQRDHQRQLREVRRVTSTSVTVKELAIRGGRRQTIALALFVSTNALVAEAKRPKGE